MISLCEGELFPHDSDYDGTDADHLPVIPGHDTTPNSGPKEDSKQTKHPVSTDPESEVPVAPPSGHVIPPKIIVPIVTAIEAKSSTGAGQQ
jgi:hypothetical protein